MYYIQCVWHLCCVCCAMCMKNARTGKEAGTSNRETEWANVMHIQHEWYTEFMYIAWIGYTEGSFNTLHAFYVMLSSIVYYTAYDIVAFSCILYDSIHDIKLVVSSDAKHICASGEPFESIRMGMVYYNLWCFFFVFVSLFFVRFCT